MRACSAWLGGVRCILPLALPIHALPSTALFRPQGQGAGHGTTSAAPTSSTTTTSTRPAPPKPTQATPYVSAPGGRRSLVSTCTAAGAQVGCTTGRRCKAVAGTDGGAAHHLAPAPDTTQLSGYPGGPGEYTPLWPGCR